MNRLLLFTLVFFLFTVIGCMNEAQEVTHSGDFNVELLFEKDGCKVYRFEDGSRYIYWSDCSGKMQSDTYHSTGKSSGYIEHMESTTN